MPAPESIHQLVKCFEDHLDSYRAGKYNETQLQRDKMVSLVERMLALHKRLAREVESVDKSIDGLVYELPKGG